MGLFDALFGRKKLPKSTTEKLGAIASAELTVCAKLSVRAAGRAGIGIRTMAASSFDRVRADLETMLEYASRDLGSSTSIVPDSYGLIWVVCEDPDFPDLVATAQIASQTLTEEGFRDQLLCALFPFIDDAGDTLHLVYSFKRGSFYAFAPRPGSKRDAALELRAHSLLEGELPLEGDIEFRYPLWGTPVG